VWANARDIDRLPLPKGYTLDTVPLLSMSKLAARVAALSKVWRNPAACPKRISRIVPPRSAYSEVRPNFDPLSTTCPSPRAAILPGHRWLLVDMDTDPHLFCPESREYVTLGVHGEAGHYAFESSENGSQINVALLREVSAGAIHPRAR
jgi:hypothetical protein